MVRNLTLLLIIAFAWGNKAYYRGDWKNGYFHGSGELVDWSGGKYIGEFEKGKRHGQGRQEYSNGAIFEGQYVKGKRFYGTYYFANGGKYTGGWKNGKRDGEGIFVNQYGVSTQQIWSAGLEVKDSQNINTRQVLISNNNTSYFPENKKNINDNIKNHLKDGKDAYFSSNYKEAIDNLSKAEEMGDLSKDLFYYLAKSYQKLNKHNDAIKALNRSLKISPDDSRALFNKAISHFRQDDLDSAVSAMLKVISIDSINIDAHYNLGSLFFKKGDLDLSAKHYLKVFENDEEIVTQYINFPEVTRRKIDSIEKIKSFEKEVTYVPDIARAYYNLGLYNFDNNLGEKAEYLFEKSLKLDSKYSEPLEALQYLKDLRGKSDFTGSNILSETIDSSDFDMNLLGDSFEFADSLKGIEISYSKGEQEFDDTVKIATDSSKISLAKELWEKGNTNLESGEIILAEELFNQALSIDPSFAPALKDLSKLYLYKSDLKKANEYAIEAVKKDEDFRGWANQIQKIAKHIQKGNQNVQETKYDEAVKNYGMILKDHPYFAAAEFYKGLARFRQKDIEGAAKCFKRALEIYPNHQKARKGLDNVCKQFLNAGNKSYKRGNITEAISYYEKSLDFDPEFYLAFFQLGVLHKKQGQSKKAIDYLRKVIEIKPDHDKTWFALGSAYESDGNNQEAIIHYNKAIEINTGYINAYGNLGKLYTDIGDYVAAEDRLKTVIQIDPEYADGFMRLGILYIEQEKFKEAVENLSISTKLDAKDFNKFFNLASAYNNVKDWDKAIAAAQSCIDIREKFGGGWLELGIAEHGKGNIDKALEYYNKAKEDNYWQKMAERKIDEIKNPQKYL